jgi:hypothetical protein
MDEERKTNETLLADGFEDAFLGYAWAANRPPLAIYDRRKAQKILVSVAGMTADEADEYLQFNVESDWQGEGTPLFLNRCTMDEFIKWSQSD